MNGMNGKNGPMRWLVVATALAALLGAGATAGTDRQTEVPDDLDIPRSQAARTNPQPATVENLAQGKTYYESQCAMCHGRDGRGRGDLAVSLDMEVPDFTDDAVQTARSDGELFYILVNGHGDMPGEGESRLSEAVRWNMILYVRKLGGRS